LSHPAGDPPDLGALSPWARELARTFVSLSSDIALVLDSQGVITNVEQAGVQPMSPVAHEWVGRAWSETVTGETRAKIGLLLQDVAESGVARRREVNHPAGAGASIPVAYTAVRLGEHGPVLAVGRDLRATAAIQQRFVEAQQDLEKGYWRVRQAESRYRLLFQVATDAVLVADATTLQIIEANQAAALLFDLPAEGLLGRPVTFGFERHSRDAVEALLSAARSSGQPAEISARLVGKVAMTSVAATPFRADHDMRLLVRVRAVDSAPASSSDLNRTLARLVDGTRDGVVVTDSNGAILLANPAFLDLVKASGEAQVRGHALQEWIGAPDQPFAALLQGVRAQGVARRIESCIRAEGQVAQAEISAALLTEGDQECIGFTIHCMSRFAAERQGGSEALQAAIARLVDSLGQQALPELLRGAAVLVERHLLDTALQRSGGDTAQAAEVLGISREELARRQAPAALGAEENASAQPGRR
jgi:transcriptional regulator PpsR